MPRFLGRDRLCGIRISASGRHGPGARSLGRSRLCGRSAPSGSQAWRNDRDRRRQSAETLLVRHGGTVARCDSCSGLCRRRRRGARLCVGARRRAICRGRGPGTDRQNFVGDGACPEAGADGLRREKRPARLRSQPAAFDGRRHRGGPQGACWRSFGRAWLDGEIAAGKGIAIPRSFFIHQVRPALPRASSSRTSVRFVRRPTRLHSTN